jgi:hypothetical protein
LKSSEEEDAEKEQAKFAVVINKVDLVEIADRCGMRGKYGRQLYTIAFAARAIAV